MGSIFDFISSSISNLLVSHLPNGLPSKSEPEQKLRMRQWNHGVFDQIVRKNSIKLGGEGEISSGTYSATEKAATEIYLRIQQKFTAYFEMTNLESSIPLGRDLKEKRLLYTWQNPLTDLHQFPPHLALLPAEDTLQLASIFKLGRLAETGLLVVPVIPEKILDWIADEPTSGTMAGLELRNTQIRAAKKNIGSEPNIGDRKDWYTDAVFAQQQFTGVNSTTIAKASADWVLKFKAEAQRQGKRDIVGLLIRYMDSMYIQDYSYFRDAIKTSDNSPIQSDDGKRFSSASVCLFHLNAAGKLHPLAIIIDFKGSIENSITVFNKRTSPYDSSAFEATNWAWRYAKMCVQISDWTCHELGVHLTHTHLVEEVLIVAAHRTLPASHIVYRLMSPHWLKTLPLNAAARLSLVPGFIVDINGMTKAQTYNYINDAYRNFDFKGHYVPTDLQNRGFPLSELDSQKFHNYVYGKDMILVWKTLRKFVSTVIREVYTSNASVQKDQYLQDFFKEMRDPKAGNMPTFPVLNTVDELIDMVVMSIHIASPQHSAVNYLQDYYQAFVPNKPASLCAPLPATLEALQDYTEEDLIRALPTQHARIWLMSSHLPYLISSAVAPDQTLLNYALTLNKLSVEEKEGKVFGGSESNPIIEAGPQLLKDLVELKEVFRKYSDEMDDQTMPYSVLNPGQMAISILL